ncbi:MAG TPA: hypothetical protein VFN23_03835 [Ktedonobacteraceae bacterium]|nr:hypothetical protein [Ktedonobacteraceae bacterium]
MATKTAKALINAATIVRVTDKTTGKFLGFGVKSNSTNDYYCVHCYQVAGEPVYVCNCYAGQHGTLCCHVKAVRELVAAHNAIEAEKAQAVAEAERIVKQAEQAATSPSVRPEPKKRVAELSRPAGFSFLK